MMLHKRAETKSMHYIAMDNRSADANIIPPIN